MDKVTEIQTRSERFYTAVGWPFGVFYESMKLLKSTRALVLAAMMLALQVALRMTVALTIGPYLRISFSYLASAVCGALLGPFAAMATDGLSDILAFFIGTPGTTGAYFPGYTITAALSGLVYGLFFFRRDIKLRHIIPARFIVCIITLGLNTLWISLQQGDVFIALLPARALKTAIQFPVDVALLFALSAIVRRIFGNYQHKYNW